MNEKLEDKKLVEALSLQERGIIFDMTEGMEKYGVPPVFVHLADVVIIDGIVHKERKDYTVYFDSEPQTRLEQQRILVCANLIGEGLRIYCNFLDIPDIKYLLDRAEKLKVPLFKGTLIKIK